MAQHKSIGDRNADANKGPQGSKEVIYFQVIILTFGNINHILSFQDALPSHSTNSRVGAIGRRFVEDENEKTGPSSSHSTNEDFVVGIEDVDVKPDPYVLYDAAQLPTINGLGERGMKRPIASDDEEEGPSPDVTKSQLLEIPPVVEFEPPEEESSSDEVEMPIRYLLFCVSHLIIPFLIYFYLFCAFKSVKENESP